MTTILDDIYPSLVLWAKGYTVEPELHDVIIHAETCAIRLTATDVILRFRTIAQRYEDAVFLCSGFQFYAEKAELVRPVHRLLREILVEHGLSWFDRGLGPHGTTTFTLEVTRRNVYLTWRDMVEKRALSDANKLRQLCHLGVVPLSETASDAEIERELKSFDAMDALGIF